MNAWYVRLTVLAVLTTSCTSEPDPTELPPVATQLAFTVNPSSRVAGQAFTPAVVVEARDASGRLASSFTGAVTVAIGTNPSAGTLSGTLTVSAVAGRATFSNLSLDKVGSGYTLTAGFGSLTSATSAAFTVTPGAASQLVFTVQPSTTTAGATITPFVKVTALDAFGNTATDFARTVTLAFGANPTGGSLSGSTTAIAVAGVATFFPVVNRNGAGYTLVAAAGGLTGATSAPFNVDVGPAAALSFTVQPHIAAVSCPARMTLAPFRVSVTDAFGNAIVSDTREVHIALAPVSTPGTLSGTTTAAAVAGVATFSDLMIDANRIGHSLVATAAGLTAATSAWFGVTDICWGPLTFSVQPSSTVAGTVITPPVVVCASDGQGGVNTGFFGVVTAALGTNPAGGTLSGTTSVAAAAGCATFSNLSINRTASGYSLVVAAAGLPAASSFPFSIVTGPATQLVCSGGPTLLQVTVVDAFGNTVTGFAGNVTVALPGGTLTVAAVAGVATFANLSLPSGSTVVVTSGALTATCGPY